MSPFPFVFIILDGWGIAPASPGNAITLAKPKFFNEAWKRNPRALLQASGKAVGLPPKQVGNSEAGHMNLGAGRVVEQDAVRISRDIRSGAFFKNRAFVAALKHVRERKGRLHIMGLLTGEESGHAFPEHMTALLRLSARQRGLETFVHFFTDGRDMSPTRGLELLQKREKMLRRHQRIATVMGRFWAMDRAKRWGRTERAYDALTLGKGRVVASASEGIRAAYAKGVTDEFLEPMIIGDAAFRKRSRIRSGDAVIFYNLRSDRARQLTKAFVQRQFTALNPRSFRRSAVLHRVLFVAMTDFGPDLSGVLTAYPSPVLADTLPYALRDVRQLYVAESEKFAHVTFFLNGGHSNPVANERRIMVPSSNVASFARRPAMEAARVADIVIEALRKRKDDFIALNLANADMVAHTGNIRAGIKAVQCIDVQLKRIVEATLHAGGQVLLTADHGNAEEMQTSSGGIDTKHNASPVPLLYFHKGRGRVRFKKTGVLGDVAPTMLQLMGRKKPAAMTGHSLVLP